MVGLLGFGGQRDALLAVEQPVQPGRHPRNPASLPHPSRHDRRCQRASAVPRHDRSGRMRAGLPCQPGVVRCLTRRRWFRVTPLLPCLASGEGEPPEISAGADT